MSKIRNLVLVSLLVFLAGCAEQSSGDYTATKVLLKDSVKPAVIKFYAEWCVTCKEYAPTFERVQAEMSDKVDFLTVDVDDPKNKDIVKDFKIAHIPVTGFISADRTDITKQFGPISYANLVEKIQAILN